MPPYAQAGQQPYSPAAHTQRPATITFATTLMVTAGLQTASLAAFVWLIILAGLESLSPTQAPDSGLYHILNRAQLSLSGGLWVPVFGFPLAAFVLGFLGLIRAAWPRLAITALGVGFSAWVLWWQSGTGWWRALVALVYVGICVALLWTPSASRWYRGDPARRPAPPAAQPPASHSAASQNPADPDPQRWWNR